MVGSELTRMSGKKALCCSGSNCLRYLVSELFHLAVRITCCSVIQEVGGHIESAALIFVQICWAISSWVSGGGIEARISTSKVACGLKITAF